MSNLKKYKQFINEAIGDELAKNATKVNDLSLIYKQILEYTKPENENDGFNLTVKKYDNKIILTNKDNTISITIKDNGKLNNFYDLKIKNAIGDIDKGKTNTSENILAYIDKEFEHTSGIDKKTITTNPGSINNKID